MRKMTRALIVGLSIALLAAACGGDEDADDTTEDTGEVEDAEDDGDDEAEDDDDGEAAEDDGEQAGALGPYRLGWALAYLSPEYAMADLYTSTGGSNYFGYANPEFDAALQAGNAATPEEADALYQEAEDILLADLPLIPMWYSIYSTVWTEKIDNVIVDPSTYLRVELLESEDGEAIVDACSVQATNLLPGDTREVCGGRLINQLFSALVEVDAETNEPELQVASAIDTEDSQVWEVTLNDGWTFHDGSPVTASSFVDAWNYAANPDNALRGQGFYSDIEGHADMGGDVTELAGLEVVDDLNFTITLTEPFSPFFTKLSDSAFFPMPDSFFENPEGFGDDPIGNGRFQIDTLGLEGDTVMTRYEDWAGEVPASLEQVTYRYYQDIATAYLDVQADALDVLANIPPEEIPQARELFGDRFSQTPTASFTYLGFPMYNETFGDNLELRQALSLAVNREEIIEVVLNDGAIPAAGVIPPVLSSYREDATDLTTFDPERAQELFEEAGGYDGTMTLYFNSGGGHEEWVEAVSNQWREVLGIEDIEFESLEFAPYLELLAEGAGL